MEFVAYNLTARYAGASRTLAEDEGSIESV